VDRKWEWIHVPEGEHGFPVVEDGCEELLQDPLKVTRLAEAVSVNDEEEEEVITLLCSCVVLCIEDK
jgi:hypothetical protein